MLVKVWPLAPLVYADLVTTLLVFRLPPYGRKHVRTAGAWRSDR